MRNISNPKDGTMKWKLFYRFETENEQPSLPYSSTKPRRIPTRARRTPSCLSSTDPTQDSRYLVQVPGIKTATCSFACFIEDKT